MTYTSRRCWSVCITTVMQLTKEMMASAPKMYMLFWIVPANSFKEPRCSFWPFASIFFPCRIQLILRFRNNKILYRILYKILLVSPPPNQVYHSVTLSLSFSVILCGKLNDLIQVLLPLFRTPTAYLLVSAGFRKDLSTCLSMTPLCTQRKRHGVNHKCQA